MNRRERKAALREQQKRDGRSRKTRRDQQRLSQLLIALTVAATIINVLFFIFLIRCHIIGATENYQFIAAFAAVYYAAWLILPNNRWTNEGNWIPFWGHKRRPEWMNMSGEEGELNVKIYSFLMKTMAFFIIVNGLLLLTAWDRFEAKPNMNNDPARSA